MNRQTSLDAPDTVGQDFAEPVSPDLPAEGSYSAFKPPQNTDYEFHVVRFKDVQQFEEKPEVYKLLSPDFLTTIRRFPGASEDFPIFFYLSNGENVCSYLRTIPDQLTVDGQTKLWAWTSDNYTYPQFRRRGFSTRLQQAATQYLHHLGIGRGSVYSTEVTQRIFKKLGFTHVGYAKRFLLLRSAAPLLEAAVKQQTLRKIAAGVLNPFVRLAVGCVRSRNKMARGRTVCRRMTDFSDPQFQELLDTISAKRSLHFGMQPGLLRLKFEVAKKNGTASAWIISDKKTGENLAYMILLERFQDKPLAGKYRGFQLMSLVDYALVDDDAGTSAALAAHCLEIFFKSGCIVLEIVSNKKCIHKAAIWRGLLPAGKGMSFNYSVPVSWQWDAGRGQLEKWPLTGFCGDGFTF